MQDVKILENSLLSGRSPENGPGTNTEDGHWHTVIQVAPGAKAASTAARDPVWYLLLCALRSLGGAVGPSRSPPAASVQPRSPGSLHPRPVNCRPPLALCREGEGTIRLRQGHRVPSSSGHQQIVKLFVRLAAGRGLPGDPRDAHRLHHPICRS